MTFLQPYILWGLPLIFLPVIIHLLNRIRHRPQQWAAMRFLVKATRSSVNNARLRQWLILLFRVLAVLMLILFVGRPLAGGWLGWALSPAPDAVLILLDRSASMEAQVPGTTVTKREQAIDELGQAARSFQETTHLVLIDSALRTPQELGSVAALKDLPLTAPTDTAADLPAMLSTALNWLVENKVGTAEIWIASDLQRSNWQPDDARWPSLISQFEALPQKVQVRLLALNGSTDRNRAVALKELVRRPRGNQSELQFALDVQASSPASETLPLTINLDGTRTEKELAVEGQSFRWRHKLSLGNKRTSGWGSFELPADANRRDNIAYFVYGGETPLHATIISPENASARLFQLALGAGSKKTNAIARILPSTALDRAVWEDNTLLLWLEPLPSGALAQRIRAFAEEGGVVIFLPPGKPDPGTFEGLGWGEVQAAGTDRAYRVLRWQEDEGPLAKSDEGLRLPVDQTAFEQRQVISGAKTILAAFEDGVPLLARQVVGRGDVYFCGTLPERRWSSLGEGPVLVPMMQRLLQAGSARLHQVTSVHCGELSAVDQTRRWECVDSNTPKDIRIEAGIYRAGDRLLAVNRPPAEDDLEVLDNSEARALFGHLALQMFQERGTRTERLQGEIWRVFLFAMLLFLVAEGLLILPPRAGREQGVAGPVLEPASEAKREVAA